MREEDAYLAGPPVSKEQLMAAWKFVHSNKMSDPFRKPVTVKEAPDYFTVIKAPMDLGTIKKRIDQSVLLFSLKSDI